MNRRSSSGDKTPRSPWCVHSRARKHLLNAESTSNISIRSVNLSIKYFYVVIYVTVVYDNQFSIKRSLQFHGGILIVLYSDEETSIRINYGKTNYVKAPTHLSADVHRSKVIRTGRISRDIEDDRPRKARSTESRRWIFAELRKRSSSTYRLYFIISRDSRHFIPGRTIEIGAPCLLTEIR